MRATVIQPDLFGEYDAEQARLEEEDRAYQERLDADRRAREEWARHFRSVKVTIAYESSGGNKPGDVLDGIVCPACGGVEFNGYLLSINHGWSPTLPQEQLYGLPPFQTCSVLKRIGRHSADGDRDGVGVVRLQEAADQDRDS